MGRKHTLRRSIAAVAVYPWFKLFEYYANFAYDEGQVIYDGDAEMTFIDCEHTSERSLGRAEGLMPMLPLLMWLFILQSFADLTHTSPLLGTTGVVVAALAILSSFEYLKSSKINQVQSDTEATAAGA